MLCTQKTLKTLAPSPLEAKPTYVKEPPENVGELGHWPKPDQVFYKSILPDIPIIRPSDVKRKSGRERPMSAWCEYYGKTDKTKPIERLMKKSTRPLGKRKPGVPTLAEHVLALPTENRWMIYEAILDGPAHTDLSRKSRNLLRDGSVGIARKVEMPDVVSQIGDAPPYDQRRRLLYFKAQEYIALEGCARRMKKMDPQLLADFMHYFYQHTVLDLKEELAKPQRHRNETRIIPEGPQLWLDFRTHLHACIRHISLDLFCRGGDVPPAFPTFCRSISGQLTLETVMIWVSVRRQEADQFLRGRFPKRWMDAINALRSLNVKKSMEIHSFVQHSPSAWWTVEATEDPVEEGGAKIPKDPEFYMEEFKRLDAMLLATFLPNTMRDKGIDGTTECIRQTKRHPKKKIYEPRKIIGDGTRRWRRMQPWEGAAEAREAPAKTESAEPPKDEIPTVEDPAPPSQEDRAEGESPDEGDVVPRGPKRKIGNSSDNDDDDDGLPVARKKHKSTACT